VVLRASGSDVAKWTVFGVLRAAGSGWRRDGTMDRSDAIETGLAVHRDRDPVRVVRPRCAEPSGQQSVGLDQQAGHMIASDTYTSRYITSCTTGAIHH